MCFPSLLMATRRKTFISQVIGANWVASLALFWFTLIFIFTNLYLSRSSDVGVNVLCVCVRKVRVWSMVQIFATTDRPFDNNTCCCLLAQSRKNISHKVLRKFMLHLLHWEQLCNCDITAITALIVPEWLMIMTENELPFWFLVSLIPIITKLLSFGPADNLQMSRLDKCFHHIYLFSNLLFAFSLCLDGVKIVR